MQLHVGLILCLLVLASGALGDYTNCKRVDNNVNYKLYWDLSIKGKIKFQVQAETAGWLGLGLSTGGEHPMISNGEGLGSDVWVGWIDPNTTSPCHSGCVYDYSVNDYHRPDLDPEDLQSITLVSAKFSEGVTTLEYMRDLDTKDSQYDRVIQPDAETTFIWALNPSSRSLPTPDGDAFLKHNADTKGVFTVKLSEPSSCLSAPDTEYSFSNEDGTYSASWVLDGDNAIKFTITAQTKGWVGIGFANSPSMIDADVYVGWIDPSGNAVMTDRYASEHSMPKADTDLGGTNSVLHVESAEDGDDDITSITFSRPLAAQDKYDLPISDGKMYVLWAYGSDNSVDYTTNTFTKHKSRGVLEVQFIDGTSTPAEPSTYLLKAHGLLMLVSFGFLLFPGVLISRFFKVLIPKWFHIHTLTQTLGVGGIVAGFAVIFVAKESVLVVGTHQIMGLVAFAAFVVQFVIGFLAKFKVHQTPTVPPVWPHKVHWWLGWGLLAWTVVTIYFGLRVYGTSTPVILIYGVWVGIGLAATVALQNMLGQTTEKQLNKYENVELNNSDMSHSIGDDDDIPAPKKVEEVLYKGKFSKPMLVLYGLKIATILCLIVGLVLEKRANVIIDPSPSDPLPPTPTNWFVQSFQFEDYEVPNKMTNYICRGFYLPNDTDYHVIGFEPVKDNQEMLHHMILYETTNYTGDDYFDCSSMPAGSTPLFTWAVGGKPKTMPPNVGFRIGKSAGRYAALQIHYDNPSGWSGRTDSSGVKLNITTVLREMDAGYFVTGVSTSSINIPPGKSYYEIIGDCDTTATFKNRKDVLPEYTILSGGLHMHMTGHQGYTEQFRVDAETNETKSLGNVVCDDYWSFNNQNGVFMKDITLRPGDKFTTHCMYDTSSKTVPTKGCESTSCEMCLNFMIYYPKVPNSGILSCGSKAIVMSNNTVKTMHCN